MTPIRFGTVLLTFSTEWGYSRRVLDLVSYIAKQDGAH